MFLFGVAFQSQVSHNVVTQYIGHVDFRASLSGSLSPSPNVRHTGRKGYGGGVGGKGKEHCPRADLGLNDLWARHQLGTLWMSSLLCCFL